MSTKEQDYYWNYTKQVMSNYSAKCCTEVSLDVTDWDREVLDHVLEQLRLSGYNASVKDSNFLYDFLHFILKESDVQSPL